MPQYPMKVGANWAAKWWGVEVVDTTPDPPVNVNPPVVSFVGAGTGALGDQVNSTVGTWQNVPDTYTYRWKRNGTNIAGALGAANPYTIVVADAGNALSCTVTATNVTASASADSANSVNATLFARE
jgi:hypothetical protein